MLTDILSFHWLILNFMFYLKLKEGVSLPGMKEESGLIGLIEMVRFAFACLEGMSS